MRARFSSRRLAPLTYDYLVLGLGAEVNFFGIDGAAEHAFPMYTLPDAVRLKDHVLAAVGGGGPATRASSTTARSTSWSSAAGRPGSRAPARSRSSIAAVFAGDYPSVPQDKARDRPRRGRPGAVLDVQADIRAYTEKALAKRRVEVLTGEVVASVSPTRVTLESGKVLDAHTLVWGAGLQGNRLVQALGLELERGNRIAVGPDLTIPAPSRGLRARRHRRDHRREDGAGPAAARLGRAAVGRARRRDDRSGGSRARRQSRSTTATRARWRRSAGARPSCRCSAGGR